MKTQKKSCQITATRLAFCLFASLCLFSNNKVFAQSDINGKIEKTKVSIDVDKEHLTKVTGEVLKEFREKLARIIKDGEKNRNNISISTLEMDSGSVFCSQKIHVRGDKINLTLELNSLPNNQNIIEIYSDLTSKKLSLPNGSKLIITSFYKSSTYSDITFKETSFKFVLPKNYEMTNKQEYEKGLKDQIT